MLIFHSYLLDSVKWAKQHYRKPFSDCRDAPSLFSARELIEIQQSDVRQSPHLDWYLHCSLASAQPVFRSSGCFPHLRSYWCTCPHLHHPRSLFFNCSTKCRCFKDARLELRDVCTHLNHLPAVWLSLSFFTCKTNTLKILKLDQPCKESEVMYRIESHTNKHCPGAPGVIFPHNREMAQINNTRLLGQVLLLSFPAWLLWIKCVSTKDADVPEPSTSEWEPIWKRNSVGNQVQLWAVGCSLRQYVWYSYKKGKL